MDITSKKGLPKANHGLPKYSRKRNISSSETDCVPESITVSPLQRPKKRKTKGLTFSSVTRKFTQNLDEIIGQGQNHQDKDINNGSSNPTTVKTRVLLLSDTHGKSKLPRELSFQNNGHLPGNSALEDQKIDVVIHSGDLSESGAIADYQATLDLLSNIPAELKLVIPGNHDLTLDKEFWERNSKVDTRALSDEAKGLFESHEMRGGGKGGSMVAKEGSGIVFLQNGIHEFSLRNGAVLRIYAGSGTPYPDGGDGTGLLWAFGHAGNTDIYNPPGSGISYAKCATSQLQTHIPDNANLDIVMTHGPPKYRLDQRRLGTGGTQGAALGCPHLFRAMRRARPKLHVFGHVHEGYGAELIRWADRAQDDVLPDDDDENDGIAGKMKLVGEETGDGVRMLDIQHLRGRGKGGRVEGEDATLFVNAALMGSEEKGELENLPWVVELDLALGGSNID